MAFTLPQLVEPPITIRNNVPQPGIVPNYTYSSQTTENDHKVYLGNEEITHRVLSASWRVGQRLPNRIGGVMKPSDGSIQLDNRDGEFNIMNPNTRYSISPGTKVRIITVIGGLQYTVFEGWLKSAVSTVNSQGIDATVLLIHSTLGYIANYDEGLFSLVAGRIRTTSQIFSAVIDTLASLNVHITVSIDPSNIRVFSQRINSTGAFGSGRNHASIMDAFRLLAQIEGGRIYDDEQGVLHFEGYNRRYTTNATVKRITATDNRNVVTHSLDDYIVNNIQSEANVLVAQNYKDLEFDRDFDEEINIPPGNWSITYTVSDPEVVLVENWETLSTKHYHYSITNLPNLVKASYQDKSIIFNIQNPTDAVATFRLHSMRGQPFIKGLDTTLHLRSEDSIRRYGTKSAEYPISLVDNQDLMRGYLQAYLDDFDGIGINGEADPIKSISVTVRNPDTIYKISDLVLLDWKTPWNINTNAHPFWVEAVDYSLDSEGNMDVTVALLDAWRGVLRKGGEVGSISLLPAIIEHEIGYIGLDLSTVEQTIDFIDLLPAIVDEAEIGYIDFVAPVEDTIGYIDIVSEGEIGFVLLPPPSEQSIGFVDLDTPLPQESEIGFIDIPEPDNKTEYMVGYIDLYEEHLESEIDFVELPIPTPTESTIGFVELPKPSETEIGSFALATYVPPEQKIDDIVLPYEQEVGTLMLDYSQYEDCDKTVIQITAAPNSTDTNPVNRPTNRFEGAYLYPVQGTLEYVIRKLPKPTFNKSPNRALNDHYYQIDWFGSAYCDIEDRLEHLDVEHDIVAEYSLCTPGQVEWVDLGYTQYISWRYTNSKTQTLIEVAVGNRITFPKIALVSHVIGFDGNDKYVNNHAQLIKDYYSDYVLPFSDLSQYFRGTMSGAHPWVNAARPTIKWLSNGVELLKNVWACTAFWGHINGTVPLRQNKWLRNRTEVRYNATNQNITGESEVGTLDIAPVEKEIGDISLSAKSEQIVGSLVISGQPTENFVGQVLLPAGTPQEKTIDYIELPGVFEKQVGYIDIPYERTVGFIKL